MAAQEYGHVISTRKGEIAYDLYWRVDNQSPVTNSTMLHWEFYISYIPLNYDAKLVIDKAIPVTLIINGTEIEFWIFSAEYPYEAGGIQVSNNKLYVPHNADGTKTFTASFTVGGDGSSIPSLSANKNFTLPAIARKATVTSAPNFTDLENPTITYNNPAKEGATKLEACISYDGYAIDVPYRAISKTDTSYTFNLTAQDKAVLYSRVTSGKSTSVKFYIKTVVGGLTYLHSLTRTFTITNPEPLLNPVITDINATTSALTGDNKVLIKYRSKAQFNSGAEAVKGSTIASQLLVNGSNAYANQTSGTIENVDSNIFDFTVTDSRGFTTKQTVTPELVPYIPLTASLKIDSFTASGEMRFTIVGKYYNGSFGAESNTMSLKVELIDGNGNSGGWVDLGEIFPIVDAVGNYTYTHTLTELNHRESYTVHVEVADLLTPVISLSTIAAPIPVFDWGKNDFNFNVPVTIQGAPLADFVIETGEEAMGSNGIWYWAKWNSGKAECYGCRNYGNTNVSTAWGNLYRSSIFTQELPYGLFADTPEVINIALKQGTYGGWIVRHEESAPTKDNSGSFMVVRPANAIITQAYISFDVVGRWK